MINTFSALITKWLIKSEVICEEEEELYHYATYSFLLTIAPLLLALIFGCLLGHIKNSIILIIPFMAIRKFSGGYHTKHPWTCIIISSAMLCLCIYVSSKMNFTPWFALTTLVSTIGLALCSPIDCQNRKLNSIEKKQYKSFLYTLNKPRN